MNRRDFLREAPAAVLCNVAMAGAADQPSPYLSEKSGLKITGVRMVEAKSRNRLPKYKVTYEKWSAPNTPKSLPMNRYGPGTQGRGDTFDPNLPLFPGVGGAFTVEITTDKGIKGYGRGGHGGTLHVPELTRYIVGEDPFDVARLWELMYLNTLSWGRSGAAIHAISGVDLALWDIIGKATGMPVYKLIGGATKTRIPAYATLNDVLWKKKIGFKKIKLALAYGPLDGRDGIKKNAEIVQYTREQLGPDGEIMLDCWMSLTEPTRWRWRTQWRRTT